MRLLFTVTGLQRSFNYGRLSSISDRRRAAELCDQRLLQSEHESSAVIAGFLQPADSIFKIMDCFMHQTCEQSGLFLCFWHAGRILRMVFCPILAKIGFHSLWLVTPYSCSQLSFFFIDLTNTPAEFQGFSQILGSTRAS